MKTAIAVKAFIVNDDNRILIMQRRKNDVHAASKWDIPGGRLGTGENPFTGLAREVLEETNLDIEILSPLQINHFTRDDSQIITMILFFCKLKQGTVKLSEEHENFKWATIDTIRNFLTTEFHDTIEAYEKNFLK